VTSRPFISVVIPAFNEAEILKESLSEILRHLKDAAPKYEIVLVDDGSTDGTWEVLRVLADEVEEMRAIKLSRNFGKESAIAAGMEFASGDAVIIMDADLQHPPDLIPEMVRLWKDEGWDVVEAVKTDRGNESFRSKLGARLFYWLMSRLTDLRLDGSSDFKLLDRRVVDTHNRFPEKSRFFRGIISWLGFTKRQIPFNVGNRTVGGSKWSLVQLVKLAFRASTSFSSLPLHFVTLIGILTFVLSIVLGIDTLYMKFSGFAVSGFTTVILLLLFIGSAIMLSLGIIGIYVSRIFDEVKGRPGFIVEKKINFEKNRE
jgi:glycosyltransferase involved in cell wall biosynthesis